MNAYPGRRNLRHTLVRGSCDSLYHGPRSDSTVRDVRDDETILEMLWLKTRGYSSRCMCMNPSFILSCQVTQNVQR